MTILMDGVTGILGSSIGAELGEDTYFLVRQGTDNKRLPAGISKDKVINCDITKPICGLSGDDMIRLSDIGIDKYLHLASNVSFATEDRDGEIWNTNYIGTRNAITLAIMINAKEFLHCSTAYAEDRRNPYEISKLKSEDLVRNSGISYSIFRPSAVIGDSKTGYTTDYNGYYGVYSLFHKMARKKRGNNSDEIISIPICMIGSSSATLNLISLDWVKYIMIALIKKESRNETYHLTHNNPQKVRLIGEWSCSALKICGINYWESIEEREFYYKNNQAPSFLQRQVDKIMNRYTPYITEERKFPLDTVIAALGAEFIYPPVINKDVITIILNYAVENNFRNHKLT